MNSVTTSAAKKINQIKAEIITLIDFESLDYKTFHTYLDCNITYATEKRWTDSDAFLIFFL